MLEQAVRAGFDGSGQQVVDVTVHRGYQPDSIRARAGVPLRVIFHREDSDACSERVVFSSPHFDRRLSATGTTIIDLPAQGRGEIRFTCGMGRYRGRIELVDAGRLPILTRIRGWIHRLETPIGTALLLWLGTLPLIALLAVFALDATAAIAAAGAAFVAWVAGCLWAFRGSTRPA
ncbi:MAG: cupredoxin domain-containing protein [Chloroflexi bacterium]|nr:cupredoxin domain-containing protein [Chloroflexota bacterium]